MSNKRRLGSRRIIAILLFVTITVVVVVFTRGGARSVSLDEARNRLDASTTIAAPPQRSLVPTAGIYAYTGSGTDTLDKPPKTQEQGPTMPVTVTTRTEGCWEFRIDYSSNHWQSWIYCPRDDSLHEEGGTTYQKWEFGPISNESTTTFDCTEAVVISADQRPDDVWTQTCHDAADTDTTSTGPYRYIGEEQLEIGGTGVPALHYRRDRTMSGGQVGTEHTDVWFHADSGLPLRNVRELEVKTSTIIGDVRYTETGSFEATSLRPSS